MTKRSATLASVFFMAFHLRVFAWNVLMPSNVTVTLQAPSTALVSWSYETDRPSNHSLTSRVEITYRPLPERIRIVVPVPSELTSYQLTGLRPGTTYSITVTSIGKGQRAKSSPVMLVIPPLPTAIESPRHYIPHGSNPLPTTTGGIHVRGEEVGIVILVLAVWAAAITLFFHRWGKIRMLLPYQPVFKEEQNLPSPTPTLPQQQQRILSNTNQFVSLNIAAMRRNHFMAQKGWPASMSRLDNLIIGRHPAPHLSSGQYQRANTIASAYEEQSLNRVTGPRKALSAEVITLTVTDCETADNNHKAHTDECAL